MSLFLESEVDGDELWSGWFHTDAATTAPGMMAGRRMLHAPFIRVPKHTIVLPREGEVCGYSEREVGKILRGEKLPAPDPRPACSVDACPRKAGRESWFKGACQFHYRTARGIKYGR